MGAGFGEGVEAAGLGLFEFAEGVCVAEVDDVDRGSGHVGEGDGAVGGFGFGFGGAGEGVEVGCGFAAGKGLGYGDVDLVAVFGVDEDQGVERGGLLHDLEHEAVPNHEDVGVGHEELEGRDAGGDHVAHLFKRFVVGSEVGDGHVEGVVDAGFAGGFGAFQVERASARV